MTAIQTLTETVTYYQTTDGNRYDTLESATRHQEYLDATKVYVVVTSGSFKVFSSLERAEQFTGSYQSATLSIREVAIDCIHNG